MATSAERQARYRKNQRQGGSDDLGSKRLDCWLSSEAWLALTRLTRHQGVAKRQVLEALLLEADQANLSACVTDEDLDTYLGVTG